MKTFTDQMSETIFNTGTQSIHHEKENVILNYIVDIFGKNGDDKYGTGVSLLLDLLIILISSLIFCYILYTLRNKGIIPLEENYFIFSKGTQDKDVILTIMFPILLLFIVVFLVSSSKKFNQYVNYFIVEKPSIVYKHHTKQVSDIFDKMIENNMSNISNSSICRNVANAVHMTLYSAIFADTDSNIIPEFKYESGCENTSKNFYNQLEEYIPKTYFDRVKLFTTDSNSDNPNCQTINNNSLITFICNVFNEDLIGSQTQPVIIKYQIQKSINNVLINNMTYDGARQIEFSDNFSHNNKIDRLKPIDVSVEIEYDVQPIVDIYTYQFQKEFKELTYRMVKRLQKCRGDKEGDGTITLDKIKFALEHYNDEYSNNIKVSYIKRGLKLVENLFSKINDVLTTNTSRNEENNKLTKFVINNYNTLQDKYDKYQKQEFIEINNNYVDNTAKYSDIEYILEYINDFHEQVILLNSVTTDILVNMTSEIQVLVKNYVKKYQYSEKKIVKLKMNYLKKHINNIDNFNLANKPSFLDTFNKIEKEYNDEIDKMNIRTVQDKKIVGEDEAKDVQKYANQTSLTVYVLLLVYLLVFYTANRLRQ